MKILEYENLSLFVRSTNSGYSLTEYRDEALNIGEPQNDKDLINIRKQIDDQLCIKVPYYEKGHLVIREA